VDVVLLGKNVFQIVYTDVEIGDEVLHLDESGSDFLIYPTLE